MTFEELLESLGITKEQQQSIIGGMKDNKIYLSAEENIDERYTKLKGQHDTASESLKEANALIEKMKGEAKDNETLQGQIADYQKKASEAEARAAKAERDSAIKVALLANGAVADDIDYLMFRIDNGDSEVKLGEDGKLSGMDDAVKALKASHPNQFSDKQEKKFDEKPLKPNGGGESEPASLAEAIQQQFEGKN